MQLKDLVEYAPLPWNVSCPFLPCCSVEVSCKQVYIRCMNGWLSDTDIYYRCFEPMRGFTLQNAVDQCCGSSVTWAQPSRNRLSLRPSVIHASALVREISAWYLYVYEQYIVMYISQSSHHILCSEERFRTSQIFLFFVSELMFIFGK